MIEDFDFQCGDLILVQNTAIEKALNRKMRLQYQGPLIVISRNRGGAYIIAELDGTVLDQPIAVFRVVPYLARHSITILPSILNITPEKLQELEKSMTLGDEDLKEVPEASEECSEPSSEEE